LLDSERVAPFAGATHGDSVFGHPPTLDSPPPDS
jgi:hypothetical protein